MFFNTIRNVPKTTLEGMGAVWAVILPVILLVVSPVILPGAAPAFASAFQPHRAVYDLNLGTRTADSTVTSARGTLEFVWNDVCDGWTISHRSRIELDHTSGRVDDLVWIFDSWENKDGQDYKFFIRQVVGGAVPEETQGTATVNAAGGGKAFFVLPEEKEVALPAGTIFPSRHTIDVMEAAQAGTLPIYRVVFDGNGGDGLFEISAIATKEEAESRADWPSLDGEKSWDLHMAIYGVDETEPVPEQEQTLRLFDNGIADRIVFDYGDFALAGRLSELELLPDPGCEGDVSVSE